VLNKIILIGRLTRDPELRHTGNGIAVASFSLAVDRPFKNQQGENETDFIRIVVWRKLAEACVNNLGKGRLVALEGRYQVRKYQNTEGENRQSHEIVADSVRFLDWPKDGNGNKQQNQQQGQQDNQQSQGQGNTGYYDDPTAGLGTELSGLPDDVPF